MVGILTVVAEEIGRVAGMVWSGVGVAVRLNNQVMTTILKASTRIVQLLLLLTHKAADLLSQLFTDLLLFLSDIGSCVLTVITALQAAVLTVYGFVVGSAYTVCSAAAYSCHLIHSLYCGFLSTLFMAAGQLGDALVAIKQAFILFGSSVLFLLGLLPNLLYLIFTGLIHLCTCAYLSCSQTFNSVMLSAHYISDVVKSSICNFFSDIPLEAIVGVVIGVGILVILKHTLMYMMDNMILIPDFPIPSTFAVLRRRIVRWYMAIVREAHRPPLRGNETEEEELEDNANDENGNDNNDNVPDLNLPENQAFAQQFNAPDPAPIGFEVYENQGVPTAPVLPVNLTRPPLTRMRARQQNQEVADQQAEEEVAAHPETSTTNNKGTGRDFNDRIDGQTYQLYRELEQEREGQLCIVCQDQIKCVILLPCRHLCLCDACRSAIITRDNICPVCRRPIRETLRVYT